MKEGGSDQLVDVKVVFKSGVEMDFTVGDDFSINDIPASGWLIGDGEFGCAINLSEVAAIGVVSVYSKAE